MLSIIIPTLNEEKYLPKLLESIKKQSFDSAQDNDYEIIVADAGSKDKTVEIAKKYNCKIVKGGLPAEGRNAGAKVAKGDLLLFLDADLILPPGFLKDFLIKFKKKKLDIATCPILPKGNKFDKLAFKTYNYWIEVTQKFLAHAAQVILVRKEIHTALKGFDPDIKLAEDHIYARKAKKIAKFGFLNTEPVIASSRRFEKDGRVKTCLKYILAECYTTLFGPIKSDIFKYKFNHYNNKRE